MKVAFGFLLSIVYLVVDCSHTLSARAQTDWRGVGNPAASYLVGYQIEDENTVYALSRWDSDYVNSLGYSGVDAIFTIFKTVNRGIVWEFRKRIVIDEGQDAGFSVSSFQILDDTDLRIYGIRAGYVAAFIQAGAALIRTYGDETRGDSVFQLMWSSPDHFTFFDDIRQGSSFGSLVLRIDSANKWDTVFAGKDSSQMAYPSVDPVFRNKDVGILLADTLARVSLNYRSAFRTTNGGVSWGVVSFVPTDSQARMQAIQICPAGGTHWIAKCTYADSGTTLTVSVIERSSDDGATWLISSSPPSNIGRLYTLNDTLVYCTTIGTTNVYLTSDHGQSWMLRSSDLLDTTIAYLQDSIAFEYYANGLWSTNLDNSPVIRITPSIVDFGLVNVGDTVHTTLTVNCIGKKQFSARIHPSNDSFVSSSSYSTDTLIPGSSKTYKLTFVCRASSPQVDSIVLSCDGLAHDTLIPIRWTVRRPVLSVEQVDVGRQLVGDTVHVRLPISNTGSKTLHIASVRSLSPNLVVAADSFSVEAGAMFLMRPSLMVENVGQVSAKLLLYSDDATSPVDTVQISWSGIASASHLAWSTSYRLPSDSHDEDFNTLSEDRRGGAFIAGFCDNHGFAIRYGSDGQLAWSNVAGLGAQGTVDDSGNFVCAYILADSLLIEKSSGIDNHMLANAVDTGNAGAPCLLRVTQSGLVEVSTQGFGYNNAGDRYRCDGQMFRGELSSSFDWNYRTYDQAPVVTSSGGWEIGAISVCALMLDSGVDRVDVYDDPDSIYYSQNGSPFVYNHVIVERNGVQIFRSRDSLPINATLDRSSNVILQSGSRLTKLDFDGRIVWQVPIFGSKITVDSASNIYVIGSSTLLTKYAPNGKLLWSDSTYLGVDDTTFNAQTLIADSKGNCYISGTYPSSPSTIVTMKFAADGGLSWVARFSGEAGESATVSQLALNNEGDLFVAGRIKSANGSWDILLLKYLGSDSSDLVTKPASTNVDPGLRVFPNPSSGKFTCIAPKSLSGPFVLRVYDEIGRLVVETETSNSTMPITIPNASGMYELEVRDQLGKFLRIRVVSNR
jgi:hypothetical protein